MGPLRARLRAETRGAHDRVDAAFARFDLHDRESYGLFLSAHAAVLPVLERAVEADASRWLPDWRERRRTAALAKDLDVLERRPPEPITVALEGPAVTLGALYVLEGSRLGARLLLTQVRAAPDPVVRAASAYLAHGDARRFWPAFLEVLEREGSDADEVVGGALATFALFERAARA